MMSHEDRKARREAIARDFKRGVPINTLMKKYGASYGIVMRSIRDDNVLTQYQRNERRKIIAKAYEKGALIEDLVKQYKVSSSTVYTAVVENGVSIRRHQRSKNFGRLKQNKTLTILFRLLRDEDVLDIAADMGVSRQYVYYVKDVAALSGFKFQ